MVTDILVNLTVGQPRDFAADFAISIASLFGAHLSAVAFALKPPVGGSVLDGLAPSIVDEWIARQRDDAERVKHAFDDRARQAGILANSRVFSDIAASAAQTFSTIARAYDLSVLAQARPDDDPLESLMIEATLFESGRPVLLVPYIQREGIKLRRVMVCWDGSRNAARAVGDSMPLLKRADRIDVVTVDQKERRHELAGAQIAEHLARHKLNVELKPIVAPESGITDVLLSHAADSSADLMVMGGYGHTRFREFVLGGATRGILGAMTMPVLMSH